MEHIREWDAKYGPTPPCCIMQGVGLCRFYDMDIFILLMKLFAEIRRKKSSVS